MTIRRLLLLLSLSFFIVFIVALSWNQWRRYRQTLIPREPPRTSEPLVEGEPPDLIISRETTYITEPLTEDGLPDYDAYVWNKYGQGVTPENNALVPVWHAVGPSPIPEKIRGELFQRLGMEALPVAGNYYIRTDDTNFVASGVAWLLPLWGFRDVPINRPGDDATAAAIDDAERHAVQEAERVFVSLVLMASEHPWRPENFPLLCQWIQDNHRPLHLAHVASNRSRFYAGYTFPEPLTSPQSKSSEHSARSRLRDELVGVSSGKQGTSWQSSNLSTTRERLHPDLADLS